MGGLLSYLVSFVSSPPSDPTPDPTTGLTGREKQLIMETWALAADKKCVKENGVEFFIQLFVAHPHMQDYFQLFKGKSVAELRSSPKMKAHATSVMYALTSYVENVEDSENLVGLIQKIAISHLGRGIELQEFEYLKVVLLNFIKSLLGSRWTPEIETAWTKLMTAHNAVYKATAEELAAKKSQK
ncbi:unnamed protein product [Lymnaea stagnalis]|uniref:Globin n=1 Tax=Lymnaea stagnalis TaxID=6523 RepID=A0AAV2H527_LYMST